MMRTCFRAGGSGASSRLLACAMLSVLVCAPVHGAALSWNNAAGGSASLGGNWLPVQVPMSVDDLTFSLAATYPVTFNATVASSRTHVYRAGTVTLTMSSPHTASTGVTIGNVSPDNAAMTLTGGTFTSNGAVNIGNGAGSTGALSLNDDDVDFIVGNGADLTVGVNGDASLSVTGTAHLVVADQFIAGSNSTSTPTVTVSGFSLAPIGISLLDVLGTGESRIGQGGDAVMTVSNGATARFAGDVIIANGSASTSSVTVQTVGLLNALLQVDGDLLIGRNSSGTAAGNGTVNVNTGGTVTVGGDTFLGDPNGGTGVLHMGGGTFEGDAPITVLAGSTINGNGTIDADVANSGNIQPSGGTGLTFNGLLTNSTINIVGNKIHFGATGGYSGSGICQADITGAAASTITPTGTLLIGANTAAGYFYLGTLAVGAQNVTLSDLNGAVLGGETTIDGGNLTCTNGIGIQNGGAIRGRGTLTGNVTNSGVIEPTDPGASPVSLDIQGNYFANPSSALELAINGPGNGDRVNVSGTATFGGTARLTFEPGYLPSIGEQYILINANGGRTGTFATLEHTLICSQYSLVLVYSTTAAIALVRPAIGVTAVGDLDSDGDQDLDDYDRWLPCMGGPDVHAAPAGCSAQDFELRADLDNPFCDDFAVDLRDYLFWQRALGN